MPNSTIPADGGAMPAPAHKTRRTALAMFAAAPALAVFPAVASASDADGGLLDLLVDGALRGSALTLSANGWRI